MEIRLAKSAGFCWGVKRAIDKVLEISKKSTGPVYTYGPLIHNPQALEELERQNIFTIDELEEAQEAEVPVVVRAHGVPPDTMTMIKASRPKVTDLTCPLVTKVQRLIMKHVDQGYDIVIVGDEGHAESIGHLGYARGRGVVVADAAQAENLPPYEKVCVISQTTKDEETFHGVVEVVRRKAKDFKAVDTICGPTYERQDEAKLLAPQVDLMVVVGGRHSGNTKRLVELCQARCPKTVWVETDAELAPTDFEGVPLVGVTAGASTPQWIIDRVVARLREFDRDRSPLVVRAFRAAGRFLSWSSLYPAAGAACLAYAFCRLLEIASEWKLFAIVFLYVFSMQSINRCLGRSVRGLGSFFAAFQYRRKEMILLAAAAAATVLMLVLSFLTGWATFALVSVATVPAVFYQLPVLGKFQLFGLNVQAPRDIAGSKEIVTALAWAAVVGLVPVWAAEGVAAPLAVLGCLWVLVLVMNRSILLGVRDVKTDRIVGKETLYKSLGRKKTRALFAVFGALAGASLVALGLVGSAGWLPWALLGLVGYTGLLGFSYHKSWFSLHVPDELVVDAQFLAAGVLAALL